MSCANPVNLRGDNGAKFLGPIAPLCELFNAVLAALSKDNNLPRIANSIIKRCGSATNNQLTHYRTTQHHISYLSQHKHPVVLQHLNENLIFS